MESRSTIRILLLLALVLWGCSKSQEEKFDTISGVLSPGENISAEGLSEIIIRLGRIHDTVDFTKITLETNAIDFVASDTINPDGSFEFKNLRTGYYVINLENGFFFPMESFLLVILDGNANKEIVRTIGLFRVLLTRR